VQRRDIHHGVPVGGGRNTRVKVSLNFGCERCGSRHRPSRILICWGSPTISTTRRAQPITDADSFRKASQGFSSMRKYLVEGPGQRRAAIPESTTWRERHSEIRTSLLKSRPRPHCFRITHYFSGSWMSIAGFQGTKRAHAARFGWMAVPAFFSAQTAFL